MTTQLLASPAVRIFGILPAASIATLLILYLMHQLVHSDFIEIIEPVEADKILTFINDADTDIKNRYKPVDKPVKPEPPTVPPAAPEVELAKVEVDLATDGWYDSTPPVIGVSLPGYSADQATPFIKVQPAYPTTASSRGIEGFVDVVFDVSTAGTTENIRIVTAVPSSIFNGSVIQAVKRRKYKPRMVDDQPVKSFDIRERIVFELAKN